MQRRKILKYLTGTFLATCGTATSILAHSFTLARHRLAIERRSIHLGLGTKIKALVLGDLHFDSGYEIKYLEKVVTRATALQPDIVLHTGDFIDQDASRSEELAKILAPLATVPLGSYACLGNHDFWSDHQHLAHALETHAHIKVLRNATQKIPTIPGLYVSALESYWAGNPSSTFLSTTPKDSKHLLICHEPDPFANITDPRILLQVSGHTHGGQCQIPFINYPPILPAWGKKYPQGHYQENGRHLYVNRGIGTVDLKVRFSCPPELTLLELS